MTRQSGVAAGIRGAYCGASRGRGILLMECEGNGGAGGRLAPGGFGTVARDEAGTERHLSFWIDADATVVTITAKR